MKKFVALLVLLLALCISAVAQSGTANRAQDSSFSALNNGNPPSGSMRHCINCKANVSTGVCEAGTVESPGSNMYAMKLNGVWKCDALLPGAGGGASDFSQLTGNASDAQVPNNITIDVAALATSAQAGDSATGFFPTGTLEPARVITGSVTNDRCLRVNASGQIVVADADCGTGGGGLWGNITGTLSNQLDLQAALDAKQALDTQLTALAGLSFTDDALIVGSGSTFESKVLPSCSNGATDKLLYNSSTNTFTCGADQTSGGGSGITTLNTLTATTQTFSKTDDTNVTLTLTPSGSDHNFAIGWTGTLADARVADNITLTNITQITNRAISDTSGDLAASRVDDGGVAATQALFSGAGSAAGFRAIADADIPNTITIDLATTATTANAGDSATAFFSSGVLEVSIGGTGAATLTGLLQGNGTSAFTAITNSTTVGQVLRVTGSNAYGWGALDLADADAVTGLLPDGNIAAAIARDSEINVQGTANEITSSGSGVAPTLSLSSTIDLGGKTSFEIPNAAAPTTDAFGEIAGDNNAWAASRGAVQAYDGTANTYLVGVLASDTPSDGQFPRWNTGGTITWETPAGSGDMLLGTAQTVTALKTFNPGTLKVGGESTLGTVVPQAFNVDTDDGRLYFGVDDTTDFWGEVYVAGKTGTLSVSVGGTGATSLTGLLQGNGTSAFTAITNSTTVGQVLRVTGSNAYGWGAVNLADTDAVTGILPAGNILATVTNSRCVRVNGSGVLEVHSADCGGAGGSPGGSDTQVQYNDGGSFGGDAGLVWNETTNTLTTEVLVTSGTGAGYVQFTEGTAPSAVADTTIITAPTAAPGHVYVLPSDTPTNGEQLTANISGSVVTLSWDAAGSGGGGAATSLNNLASVAINTTLVSDTDNTDDLGTSSIGWKDLYMDGDIVGADAADFNSLIARAGTIYLNSGATVIIARGTGSPEGVLTAGIGSLFLRSDGGTDTALYRKESGTGNTGWVATAAGGGGGANTALSNLASVAINTTLVSDTDNTDDLGTTSIRWKDLFLKGVLDIGGSGAGYLQLTEGTAPSAVADTTIITAPTAAPGHVYVLPSDTPTNGEQLTANISGSVVTLSWDAAGSGGSGTVTNTGGSLTANAIVLGAGTVDTKVSVGITSNGNSKIILGNAGTTEGTLEFVNQTSGSLFLTPPATGALGASTLTLPIATDTLVGKATTDVFTNKSIDLASNTVTGTLAQFNTALSDGNFATDAAASETVAGLIEIATTAEINTGTDAGRAMAPDQFAASNFGTRIAPIVVFDSLVDTAVGDGRYYFPIPAELNGMILVGVTAQVTTVGTTNTLNVDLARCAVVATGNTCSGTVVDMLSTNLTIDSNENKSSTAAAAAVIDTANDDVATDQTIRVDIDAVHTTPAKGLVVTLTFRLP